MMNIHKLVISLIAFSTLQAQPFLLQSPKTISKTDIDQLPRSRQACFCSGQNESNFLYNEGKMAVQLSSQRAVLYESVLWKQLKGLEVVDNEAPSSYFLGPQRCLSPENNKPQEMTIKQVAECMLTKQIVFYTGAGRSLAAGVQDMNGLMALLDMQNVKDFFAYVDHVKTNEQRILQSFADFCHRAFTAEPTPAHKIIAAIALAKKAQVMTENFDFLQQRSGIVPFEVSAQAVSHNVSLQEIRDVDALVCIGMSADDKGLLQWYKDHNPQGKIIAFNLSIPQYLGHEDYVVLGDLQKTLPAAWDYMQNFLSPLCQAELQSIELQ